MRVLVLIAGLIWPLAGLAQAPDPGELASIRTELTQLYAEIKGLRAQLETEAAQGVAPEITGPSTLRLDRLEEEMRVLTGRVENLAFRVGQIAEDGTRRIGDLEFRLVELEGGDVSQLGETPLLGGEAVAAVTPAPAAPASGTTVELAVGEESDFDAAQQSLGDGEYANAILQFGQFLSDYPGGPLSARAMFHMGEAQEALAQHKEAARSFLDSFSADPKGSYAAQALMRVGVSLSNLGKVENACQTWSEVLVRYPNSDVVAPTKENQQKFGCS